MDWILNVKKNIIRGLIPKQVIKYKKWQTKDLLVFRFQFNITNTECRILLVKVKNENYIEFHLGKHNYYDRTRKKLGLRN